MSRRGRSDRPRCCDSCSGPGRPEGGTEPIPPEALLKGYRPAIRALAERLRVAVQRAEPDAIERVRPGWRLIGYDVPSGRRTAYFAYVAPEPEHVHLGFEWGALMADPDGRLLGKGITRRARWLTYRPGGRVDAAGLGPLVREGVRVALLSRGEKLGRMLDR